MYLLVFFLITTTTLFSIDRNAVAQNDRWNIEALYPSFDAWQKELAAFIESEQPPHFTRFRQYESKLSESPEHLAEALTTAEEISRKLEKLHAYALLQKDVDLTCHNAKTAYGTISELMKQFSQAQSFLDPEILALSDETIACYQEHPGLTNYRFLLEKIYRNKPHTLTKEQEELLSLTTQPLDRFSRAFSAISDADFRFSPVYDASGDSHELTHSSFYQMLLSPDVTLRKNSFKSYYNKYLKYENTLCELLTGYVQGAYCMAKARKFPSTLHAAMHSSNIDPAVYHTLISTVRSRIDVLHRYISLRKKVLNLQELHTYDLYCPLVPSVQTEYSFDQAVDTVLKALQPLGSEYVTTLEKGLKVDRWVDRYENKGKRTGGYSLGNYDSMPYILMNFDGSFNSVLTLAHESGHSMHTHYTRSSQPYIYAHYDLFVAEVASLFNEGLVFKHFLKNCKNNQEKASILSEALDRMRAALFRQTLFAEFELFMHECVKNSIPLTPKLLKDKYQELVVFYHGPDLTVDTEVGIEWSRVPHFYRAFYVYQYATGISAALALNERVLNDGEEGLKDYHGFLKAGGSDYPLNILKKSGVDMTSNVPIHKAIDQFASYLTTLESLLN